MRIYFPGFYLPGYTLYRGQLLDVYVLMVRLRIPPWTIRFWSGRWIWLGFVLFDTDWITSPISDWLSSLRSSVWTWIYNSWSGIITAVNNVKSALTTILHNAWSGITDSIDQLWASTYTEIHRLWDAAIAGQVNLTSVLYAEIHKLWDAIIQDVDKARMTIIGEVKTVADTILSGVVDFINRSFIGVAKMLIESLDEMARDYYERHSEEK